jgi:general secretion pathway protein D
MATDDEARQAVTISRSVAEAAGLATLLVCLMPRGGCSQLPSTMRGGAAPTDSVTIRIAGTELRAAVQMLGRYLDRPILFNGSGTSLVTLETPAPVPRADVPRMLRGLLESEGYELVVDSSGALYHARPREGPRQPLLAPNVPVPARSGIGGTAQPLELFVIALKHARAADVAQTVNALYGRGLRGVDAATRPSTLSEELRGNLIPTAGPVPPEAVPGVAGRSATLTGELSIVPDARANSLLIRANRNDFELVHAVVEELDVRPLQALIEVLIAEVRRQRSLALGVSAKMPKTTVGKGGATISAGIGDGSLGLGDFVLEVLGIGGLGIDATLQTAAQRGEVRILSRPVVLTANNELAEIVVGSQRPFVQVSRSLPTDAAVRDQVVQYKDVGTKLSVRPTISSDGSVQLEVTQEVSSATTETQFNAPIISTRSIKTQLLVRDGQTIVLGGLTDRQRDRSTGGVPFLSAIPFFGGFFGHADRSTMETELFVFLTPRVIRSDEDAMRLSQPMRERAEKAKP